MFLWFVLECFFRVSLLGGAQRPLRWHIGAVAPSRPHMPFRPCPTTQVVLWHCAVSDVRCLSICIDGAVSWFGLLGDALRLRRWCIGAVASASRVLSNVPHNTGGVAVLCSLGARCLSIASTVQCRGMVLAGPCRSITLGGAFVLLCGVSLLVSPCYVC